jgi:hypothetical protein
LLKDDIIEISDSPFFNSLTVVPREGKTPRICVDARKINYVTILDTAKTPPSNELLQKFHGVRYVTSIHLSLAFLQIPLKKESRLTRHSYLNPQSISVSVLRRGTKIVCQLLFAHPNWYWVVIPLDS